MEKPLFVTASSLHSTTTLTHITFQWQWLPNLLTPLSLPKAPAKVTEGSKAAGKGGKEEKKCCKVCKEMYPSRRTTPHTSRVLKQVHAVHPDTGISNKVMAILHSFVNDTSANQVGT